MVLLEVEDRRLSEQQVLSYVLLVVPKFHFLLVNFIDELFNLVRMTWLLRGLLRVSLCSILGGRLNAQDLLLQNVRELGDFEVGAVLQLVGAPWLGFWFS